MFTHLALVATLLVASVDSDAYTTGAQVSPAATQSAPAFSVQVTGAGRSMILIPGLSCAGNVWDATVAHYRDRYQVHVLTLAGFRGQPAIDGPLLKTVHHDLVRYIKEHRLEKPVIIGHSLGGFLAFWVASSEPSLVGPVIAVDGVPFMPALMDPAATEASSAPRAEAMRAQLAALPREQFIQQNRMSLGMMVVDPAEVERVAAFSTKSDPASVAGAMAELMSIDLRDDVARMRAPALLIGAGAFLSTPELRTQMGQAYEKQIEAIPHHRFALAEKARHFVMLDDPAFFFAEVDRFLTENAVAGATIKMGGAR